MGKTRFDQLVSFVSENKWGNFNNRGMFLLVRSLQARGVNAMRKKMVIKMRYKDISIFKSKKEQLSAIVYEPPFSDDEIKYFQGNQREVLGFIDECNRLLAETKRLIVAAERLIKEKDFEKSVKAAKRVMKNFSLIGHWKYYITSISDKIYGDASPDFSALISALEKWKNNEEYYNFEGDFLISFAHFVSKHKAVGTGGLDLVKFLHIKEFDSFIAGGVSADEIVSIIRRRKEQSYVHVNMEAGYFADFVFEGGSSEGKAIVEALHNKRKEKISNGIIKGKSVVRSEKIVRGECVVFLKRGRGARGIDFTGKILVTSMTTPEFIPYIKGVKGLIADTGGMTCHAAIIAREFDLPCIVGTLNATSELKTGDLVEMDLFSGAVRKI